MGIWGYLYIPTNSHHGAADDRSAAELPLKVNKMRAGDAQSYSMRKEEHRAFDVGPTVAPGSRNASQVAIYSPIAITVARALVSLAKRFNQPQAACMRAPRAAKQGQSYAPRQEATRTRRTWRMSTTRTRMTRRTSSTRGARQRCREGEQRGAAFRRASRPPG